MSKQEFVFGVPKILILTLTPFLLGLVFISGIGFMEFWNSKTSKEMRMDFRIWANRERNWSEDSAEVKNKHEKICARIELLQKWKKEIEEGNKVQKNRMEKKDLPFYPVSTADLNIEIIELERRNESVKSRYDQLKANEVMRALWITGDTKLFKEELTKVQL